MSFYSIETITLERDTIMLCIFISSRSIHTEFDISGFNDLTDELV